MAQVMLTTPAILRFSHEEGEIDNVVEITPPIEDEWVLGSWMLPNGELVVISVEHTYDEGGGGGPMVG